MRLIVKLIVNAKLILTVTSLCWAAVLMSQESVLVSWLGYTLPVLIRHLPVILLVDHSVLSSFFETPWVVTQSLRVILCYCSHVGNKHAWLSALCCAYLQEEQRLMLCFPLSRSKAWTVLGGQNTQFGSNHGSRSSWGSLLQAYGKYSYCLY